MIIILPQVRVEAADPLMVKVVTDNLEVSHNETEAKDLNIVNVNFRMIDFREVHFNRTVLNTATTGNSTFREIKQIATEAVAVAGVLSNLEDKVTVCKVLFTLLFTQTAGTGFLVPVLFGSHLHLLSEGCALVWGMFVRGCARRDLC